jgi:hypothetical protein
MFHIRRLRPVLLVSLGVVASAAAGIGGAAAASSGTTPTTAGSPAKPPWPPIPADVKQRLSNLGARLDRIRGEIQSLGIDGPPVHEDLVVPSSGGGFESVTIDSGIVRSLSGDSLTITEGYAGKTYKTVTLTIPSGAAVDRNFAAAKLSDLRAGDRVSVARTPQGTHVTAYDASHAPAKPFVHRPFTRVPVPGLPFVP